MDCRRPSSSLLPAAWRWAGPLLAAAYGLGSRLDRALARPRLPPLPAICIGNITVGGTGKTPATRYLARGLASRGRKPAVLLRGYREQAGDEAVELQSALSALGIPVLLGADRLAAAARAKEQGCDVALLDDGFQHWRLARDLDIVLVDATDPFGGNHLVPWGRLREAPPALSRASAVIITRADMVQADELSALEKDVARYAPRAVRARACHRPVCLRSLPNGQTMPLDLLRGAAVRAVCGIGNPESFCRSLSQLGATVAETVLFPDHHEYTKTEVDHIKAFKALDAPVAVVTTAKDAAKLSRLLGKGKTAICSLEIEFAIMDGEEALWAKIDEALQAADNRKSKI